ncbi:hypothetical protein [Sphingomonas sp. SRS2]|uniref:hypothetical protein n=1 Tax=Sphingomonas sp. SRS2 TaxID=133190 RepID=UPI00128D0AE4|nr:hypothetical protein [Sphingomonas sp. SRS2]
MQDFDYHRERVIAEMLAQAIIPIVTAACAEVARDHKADEFQRSVYGGLSQYGHGYEAAAEEIATAIEHLANPFLADQGG